MYKLVGDNMSRLSKIKIALTNGYNNGKNRKYFELKIHAFMLTDKNKVKDNNWLVFNGQKESPDKSIRLIEDNNSSSILDIHMDKIDKSVQKVVFILDLVLLRQRVETEAKISVIDPDTNAEMIHLGLLENDVDGNSLVLGKLIRIKNTKATSNKDKDDWRFQVLGNVSSKDLIDYCEKYGVKIGRR